MGVGKTCLFAMCMLAALVSIPVIEACSIGAVSPPPPSSPPPSQSSAPSLVSATTATCGHSIYYKTVGANPGAGVIGGLNAQPNEYPWLVRLQILLNDGVSVSQCSGTIVAVGWVLTAAHCVSYVKNFTTITVFFGQWNQTNAAESTMYHYNTSTIIFHSSYNPSTGEFDYALLRLTTNVTFSSDWNTQRICLPTSCSDGTCGTGLYSWIAGWGITQSGNLTAASVVQKAFVQIQDTSVCRGAYLVAGSAYITDNMVCAGYTGGGVDSCLGDYGGPLMSTEKGYYLLCGVSSFGNGCGQQFFPGVYGRVCTIVSWITQVTGVVGGSG